MNGLRWILFDLNGTLLDPTTIADGLPDAIRGDDPSATAHSLLTDSVVQAMADTATGHWRPFPTYLEAALARRTEPVGLDRSVVDDALERAARMPAFPDAKRGLTRLAEAGLRLGVVTNSGRDPAEDSLEAAGLRDHFEVVVGSDEIEVFKPDARVYRHGLARAGAEAAHTCLVASHAWDLLGARRAGLAGAWIDRGEGALLETVPEVLATGADLGDLAATLVGFAAG
ncbi:MAG: haloacid dehalogenase type II [Solirubrobacterales bacterium]